MHHLAIYPGSFDPMTLGHLDVIARARRLFDEIVVGIGINPEKQALFSPEERLDMANTLLTGMMEETPNGAPVRAERYERLTVDFASSVGAAAILRGIRNVSDLTIESQLAITNRQVADIETAFVLTGERFAFTSSSLIRQVAALGADLDGLAAFVPPLVLERLREKAADPDNPVGRYRRDMLID
ncbi:MAG: pantetheine-phosphate adenylyltransferase [Phycisphaerales bacterium]